MRLLSLILLALTPLPLCAQESPYADCDAQLPADSVSRVEKTWALGVGHNALLDTYLSQEHYSGVELDLLHIMTKQLKNPRWSRTHTYSLSFAYTKPRSDAATDYFAMFDYSFAMHRTVRGHRISAGATNGLTIAVGGQADAYLGGIYNSRNGNNPGQLKLGADIAPTVRATYTFPLWGKTIALDYTASLPLIGLEFSPAYGQSYYEIFTRDDYDHNVCLTSPFNAVNFTQRLLVHIPFGRKSLSFGYMFRCRQSDHNSLKYHSYTNSFIIGITL